MILRHITSALIEALSDNPVVFLGGARQTGKSTLAQWLASSKTKVRGKSYSAKYLTLDNSVVLSAVQSDPSGFIANAGENLIIDEVQRVPELFLAIKAEVDKKRIPGRFFLTGSADVMLLPTVTESLTGRLEILTLWPFSRGEIEGRKENFIDNIFSEEKKFSVSSSSESIGRDDLIKHIVLGGFPEALNRDSYPKDPSDERRRAWFESYVTSIIQRDILNLSSIEGATAIPRLFSILTHRTMTLMNFSELSRISGFPQSTLKRYIALLETTFLIQTLPAWSRNLNKRLLKTPKLYVCDTGLACAMLGINEERLLSDGMLLGPLLENFIITEIRKELVWSVVKPKMYHLRTLTGQEVDLVLEDASGMLVGIEIKSSSAVNAGDFKGLKALAELAGKEFIRGVILYAGSESVPFGKNLWALPVSSLWKM